MKNIFKLVGIIAMIAVIGFSFAACGDGAGGGGTAVDSKWIGTYASSGGNTMTIAADMATNAEGEHPIYSDEGTSTDDEGKTRYEYNFRYNGSASIMSLYFYEDESPVYLTYGGTKYVKQP